MPKFSDNSDSPWDEDTGYVDVNQVIDDSDLLGESGEENEFEDFEETEF